MKGAKSIMTVFVAIVLAASLAFLGGERTAQAYNVNTTSTASVTVTIGQKTIVDVTPQTLNYGTNDPGTVVYNYTENGLNLSQIQVENLGSTNLTYIWLNVTQPTSNPFGSGLIGNYDSANWLLVKNTTQTNYAFVDRLEFNASTDIIYLNLDTGVRGNGSFGRFRDANREYFWMINGTLSGTCNGSAGSTNTLVVGTVTHNETQTGTIDLVNGAVNVGAVSDVVGDDAWGLVDGINVGGVTYCAAVAQDCTSVRLYRWNADAPGASACTAVTQAEMTINNGQTVYPGGSVIADIQLHIPYGVPQGSPTGTLSVIAEAA